jgi:hypothetical protein
MMIDTEIGEQSRCHGVWLVGADRQRPAIGLWTGPRFDRTLGITWRA